MDFVDPASLSLGRSIGLAEARYRDSPSSVRSAVDAALVRRLAAKAAQAEGGATDERTVAFAAAGRATTPGPRLAARYAQAIDLMSSADDPLEPGTIAVAIDLIDDAVHTDPERRDATIKAVVEDVLASMGDPALEGLPRVMRFLADRKDRLGGRVSRLVIPFVVRAACGTTFLPPVDESAWWEDADAAECIRTAMEDIERRVAEAKGRVSRARDAYSSLRTGSAVARIVDLSFSLPVLTQAIVERQTGLTHRGALHALNRLSEGEGAILRRMDGNAAARRFYVNETAF